MASCKWQFAAVNSRRRWNEDYSVSGGCFLVCCLFLFCFGFISSPFTRYHGQAHPEYACAAEPEGRVAAVAGLRECSGIGRGVVLNGRRLVEGYQQGEGGELPDLHRYDGVPAVGDGLTVNSTRKNASRTSVGAASTDTTALYDPAVRPVLGLTVKVAVSPRARVFSPTGLIKNASASAWER